MCNLVNIAERDPQIDTPEFEENQSLIQGVFQGRVTPENLPVGLFAFTFFTLAQQVLEGFGLPSDFPKGSPSWQQAGKAKTNLGLFSGAKTFHNVVALSMEVSDSNGQLRSFGAFKEIALKINERYNVDWLAVEQSAAFRQSQAIESWIRVQEDKDIFPLLKYSTARDARVRPSHRSLDGVVKPVDSPFWDRWFPPNGWHCRCIVQRLRSAAVSQIQTPENTDFNFNTNVGKTGLIFSNAHPYFEVPPEFKHASATNFGFTIPPDADIRRFSQNN